MHSAGPNDPGSPGAPNDSPFVEFDRNAWGALAATTPLPLTEVDLERLRSLGDPLDLAEADITYRPLSRLLNLYVRAAGMLHRATNTFLASTHSRVPFVIGIAGSVAVGKSTSARVLCELLSRWSQTPRVQLVTTDGFLYPNDELERRGLLERKGFPESYDRRALLRFLTQVKAGHTDVKAPVYSHLRYDIVPGEHVNVRSPDVLIVEGLNVLQPARPSPDGKSGLVVSDFFDFSIYIDANEADIKRWYIERFLSLRATAFADPSSYFHSFAAMSDAEAVQRSSRIWEEINAPNLELNVLPTRGRATLVLTKDGNHRVSQVRLRKL